MYQRIEQNIIAEEYTDFIENTLQILKNALALLQL